MTKQIKIEMTGWSRGFPLECYIAEIDNYAGESLSGQTVGDAVKAGCPVSAIAEGDHWYAVFGATDPECLDMEDEGNFGLMVVQVEPYGDRTNDDWIIDNSNAWLENHQELEFRMLGRHAPAMCEMIRDRLINGYKKPDIAFSQNSLMSFQGLPSHPTEIEATLIANSGRMMCMSAHSNMVTIGITAYDHTRNAHAAIFANIVYPEDSIPENWYDITTRKEILKHCEHAVVQFAGDLTVAAWMNQQLTE